MNSRAGPLRLRVAAALALAAFSFGLSVYEAGAVARRLAADARALSLAEAEAVAQRLELSRRGDWSSRGGYLFKGGERADDATSIRRSLAGYLAEDAVISFGVGDPPAPLPGEAGADAANAARPFLSALGAVFAAKDGSGKTIGWVSVSSGERARSLRRGRLALRVEAVLAGACLALVGAFGAIALRLSRPAGAPAGPGAGTADGSRNDPLTGLLSRRGLGESFEDPLSNHGLSHVAIVDIDRFASVVGERGREEGDRLLGSVAKALTSIVRGADLCGRWEGESFAVVYRGLADEYAAVSGERIRSGVEARAFGPPEAPLRVTVTVGIAAIGGRGLAEAAAEAERAMLEGKGAGRNRVVLAGV